MVFKLNIQSLSPALFIEISQPDLYVIILGWKVYLVFAVNAGKEFDFHGEILDFRKNLDDVCENYK